MNEPPDVVSRYFERDAQRDVEAIVALFSGDGQSWTRAKRDGEGGDPRTAWRYLRVIHSESRPTPGESGEFTRQRETPEQLFPG